MSARKANRQRVRHRARQRRFEARLRDGVAVYGAPLGAVEINALVALGWLREGAESDRSKVGDAVSALLHDMALRLR
jgi:hypothetical protein